MDRKVHEGYAFVFAFFGLHQSCILDLVEKLDWVKKLKKCFVSQTYLLAAQSAPVLHHVRLELLKGDIAVPARVHSVEHL